MLYLAALLTFVSALFIFYFVLLGLNSKAIEMSERINTVENLDKVWMQHKEEVGESVLSALFKNIGIALIKLTPSYKSNKYRLLLDKAGVLSETTAEKFIARKAIISVSIAITVSGLTIYLSKNITYAVLFVVLAVLLINTVYKFNISKRVKNRGTIIVRSLPFTLDLITVSVEAGLSLDGAIGRIVGSIEGPLSDEFGQTLKEMRMGIEKKMALKNMSERVAIKDVSMLLSSLIQADELGVSLGKILRIEGAQLREKRKQAAREKAMKAPIKMLFPLMIFIFPTIFVIVLGPAVISMMEIF